MALIKSETDLQKVDKYSHGESNTDNFIIKGDNNLVLDAILNDYKSCVQCIYIDPPYNNKEEYNHYKDDKDHKTWLNEVKQILVKLRKFLSDDGSIWISIDDSELHYLKVLADEVFGRSNFIHTIVWQHRKSRENRRIFSNNHEYILVYSKDPNLFKKKRNLLDPSEEQLSRYKNPDNDPRGRWQSVSANVQAGHASKSQFYTITAPNGKKHDPPNGRCWVYNENRMKKEIASNNIWFGIDGNGVPRIKKFMKDKKVGLNPETLWDSSFSGTTKSAKKHLLKMFPESKVFDTPKPEELIENILKISTDEGDLVLDCFLGSGTTAAVAHKMNRKYIGVEVGDHVIDIATTRLKKVIEGEKGGISKSIQWEGGGGFNFLEVFN